ncbi:hypothetical protein BB8028_0004g02560 [Beauveria bassiana]|uniref:Uncharacterized protein n=1 Tax=Beauveria bassiana TaxID=176275 RepID=A0A2S7YB09_BEABA|nr:hypothetical protein BB8028_0004g02560 [Beauveria bassiana]
MLGQLRGPCLRLISVIGILASRFFNARFVYSLAVVCTLAAKTTHIRAHLSALRTIDLFLWGPTFFFQDLIFLLALRWVCDLNTSKWRLYKVYQLFAACVSLGLFVLATASMLFYSIAGTQLHWRNAAFDCCSIPTRIVLRIVTTVTKFASQILRARLGLSYTGLYTKLEQDVLSNDSIELSHQLTFGQGDFVDRLFKSPGWKFVVVLFSSLMVYEIVLFIILPPEPTFIFMSWAVLALPVIDVHASSALGVLHPIFGAGMHFEWNTTTALANTGPLPWLPNGTTLQGFEDWYDGKEHYSPAHDPLHISNLKDDLLPELRGVSKNISIRHISLIKLESTRKDVFPFNKDGYIWKSWRKPFATKGFLSTPSNGCTLGTLTPTANRMTGDYEDGFHHLNKTPRGSISFDNAFTTATYTRKCFTGTLCGVTPLVSDFNVEFENHIYQPCFPQICNAFNKSTTINDTDHITYP